MKLTPHERDLLDRLAYRLDIHQSSVLELALRILAEKEKVSIATTYSVYIIYCHINGKGYVGVTLHPRVREREHFSKLRDGVHPNDKLQECYRQLGVTSFSFEVLEREINDKDKYARELYWIKAFNSIENGFNQVFPTREINQGVTWNGIKYKTLKCAAQANGITTDAMARRLRGGYTCDADMKNLNSKHQKAKD